MASTPLIATQALEFQYHRDASRVLRGFEHAFARGSLTALTGPSGCGKSTVLYLLGLLLRPTGGRILWDGVDLSRRSDAERSLIRGREIGFVFQDAILDPSRSILQNVMEGALYARLPPGRARVQSLALLRRFDIKVRATRRPGEISGGQAQRVALCRALVKEPRLILADEPSGNLDEASADVVWAALAEAATDGCTVVVATHDWQRAASADTVIAL
jgi:lipoprotein-releasing system ATP-binding protein